MSEDVHINDDLPIPAAAGWEEMKAMLNKEMPVSKFNRKRLIASILPVIILTISLLICTKELNTHFDSGKLYNYDLYSSYSINAIPVNALPPVLTASFAKSKNIQDNHNPKNHLILLQQPTPKKSIVAFSPKENHLPDSLIFSFSRFIITPEKYKPTKQKAATVSINTALSTNTASKKIRHKKLSLFAGVGINTSLLNNQNFQPYPAAALQYNFTPKFFVSTGISLFSAAPGFVSGVSKTLYINDSANNLKLYNEETTFNKFEYLDIPVFIGVQLNKNISIKAGIQASFLLSKKNHQQLVAYDFQMNSIDAPFATQLAPAAYPQQNFKINVPSVDYRFISGIDYKIKKTSIALTYQQPLQGHAAINNRLVSLHLYYQLK